MAKDALARALELVQETLTDQDADKYDRRLSTADTLVRLASEARYLVGEPDEVVPREMTINLVHRNGRPV